MWAVPVGADCLLLKYDDDKYALRVLPERRHGFARLLILMGYVVFPRDQASRLERLGDNGGGDDQRRPDRAAVSQAVDDFEIQLRELRRHAYAQRHLCLADCPKQCGSVR